MSSQVEVVGVPVGEAFGRAEIRQPYPKPRFEVFGQLQASEVGELLSGVARPRLYSLTKSSQLLVDFIGHLRATSPMTFINWRLLSSAALR